MMYTISFAFIGLVVGFAGGLIVMDGYWLDRTTNEPIQSTEEPISKQPEEG
jgi:hypothetical protein